MIIFRYRDHVHRKAGVHGGQSFKRQQGGGRRARLIEEFEADLAHLLGEASRERIELAKAIVLDANLPPCSSALSSRWKASRASES